LLDLDLVLRLVVYYGLLNDTVGSSGFTTSSGAVVSKGRIENEDLS